MLYKYFHEKKKKFSVVWHENFIIILLALLGSVYTCTQHMMITVLNLIRPIKKK